MKETSIDYLKSDDHIAFFTSDPKYMKRLRKQIEVNPDVVDVRVDDGETLGVWLPVSWFRSPAPPAKRKPMTEEQRQAARERMQKLVAVQKQDS